MKKVMITTFLILLFFSQAIGVFAESEAEVSKTWTDWSQAAEYFSDTDRSGFDPAKGWTGMETKKPKVLRLDTKSKGRMKDLFEMQKKLNRDRPEKRLVRE